MTVAFLDTVHPILKNRLIENGFHCKDYLTLSREDIIQGSLTDIDGIVLRSRLKIDVEIFKSIPNLKWIARSGSGLENIDLIEANAREIHVYNSPEGNRDAVGEHVLGMILMILHTQLIPWQLIQTIPIENLFQVFKCYTVLKIEVKEESQL